jgi:fermentation-respiration switch protein FrsA (DUF1100 family)
MFDTARSLEQPMLLVQYTGDQVVFPADVERIYQAVPSADRTRMSFCGDHHGQALVQDEPPARTAAGEVIREWLRDRFPRS